MTRHPSPRDWVRQAGDIARIPCIEAYFQGHGYAPHRHDTYAIGRTLSGAQAFGVPPARWVRMQDRR